MHSPVDFNISITKFVFYFCNIIYFQWVGEHEIRKGLKAGAQQLAYFTHSGGLP